MEKGMKYFVEKNSDYLFNQISLILVMLVYFIVFGGISWIFVLLQCLLIIIIYQKTPKINDIERGWHYLMKFVFHFILIFLLMMSIGTLMLPDGAAEAFINATNGNMTIVFQ